MNCPGHCLIFDHRVRSYRGELILTSLLLISVFTYPLNIRILISLVINACFIGVSGYNTETWNTLMYHCSTRIFGICTMTSILAEDSHAWPGFKTVWYSGALPVISCLGYMVCRNSLCDFVQCFLCREFVWVVSFLCCCNYTENLVINICFCQSRNKRY